MLNIKTISFSLIATLFLSSPAFADFKTPPSVERLNSDSIELKWENKNPVDIYILEKSDSNIKGMKPVATKVSNSFNYELKSGDVKYFVLKDSKDSETIKVGERLLPLEDGSNFRDIGGYKTIDGKRVKWGMIYRSGSSSNLNVTDISTIKRLNLKTMVDLRSDEERALAPSKIDNVRYVSYNYSFMSMMPKDKTQMKNGAQLYHNMPYFLKPQIKEVFAQLLQKQIPLEYNCSAGQDRTGVVTAIVLSALGVPRETIIADYRLSTQYRKPLNEMPEISPEMAKSNPVAGFFAQYRNAPGADKAQPLWDENNVPFLSGAFDEIDEKWGSVDQYLKKEIGLSDKDITTLKAMYLE